MSVLGDLPDDMMAGEPLQPAELDRDYQVQLEWMLKMQHDILALRDLIEDPRDGSDLSCRLQVMESDVAELIDRAYLAGRMSVIKGNAEHEKTFKAAVKNTERFKSQTIVSDAKFLTAYRKSSRQAIKKTDVLRQVAAELGVSLSTAKRRKKKLLK